MQKYVMKDNPLAPSDEFASAPFFLLLPDVPVHANPEIMRTSLFARLEKVKRDLASSKEFSEADRRRFRLEAGMLERVLGALGVSVGEED